jgi:hypothetical protein
MSLTAKQIKNELSLIEKGEDRTWGQLFITLDSVDKSGYWHCDSNSFTEWLSRNDWMFPVKSQMLWRYLAAGRFVRQEREGLLVKGIVVPELAEMSDAVSPENIEILAKLKRVIPEEKFAGYAEKVFTGNIKRKELRNTWQTYRPALEGKTARGRGVTEPCIDQQNPFQKRMLFEALTLESFQAAGASWTMIDRPVFYHVYLHVTPDGLRTRPNGLRLFPAVALVKPKDGLTQCHGLIMPSLARPPEKYILLSKYCDYLWAVELLIPEFKKYTSPLGLSNLPDHVGILRLSDASVHVVKPAKHFAGSGTSRDELFAALLLGSAKV